MSVPAKTLSKKVAPLSDPINFKDYRGCVPGWFSQCKDICRCNLQTGDLAFSNIHRD